MEFLKPDSSGIARAADWLRAREVIGFPTDTVYGLAAVAADAGAVERIFEIKGRPRERPLVVMVADVLEVGGIGVVDDRARRHMERWWPGPLTLVLPTRTGGSVAVRIPDHPVAAALLREVREPLATTSANLSGHPPALTASETALPGVAAVIDGGHAPGGVASTVLDLTGAQPRILRPGPLTAGELLSG